MDYYFAPERASLISQMGGFGCFVSDSEEVLALRGAKTYDELIALGKALCDQLRYREAIDIYTKAIDIDPEEMTAYRQRAARYISTLQPRRAIQDLLRCRELGGDEEDLSYRLGIAYYLAGEYVDAIQECSLCHCLSDDEMGVAAIFWHTLSAWKKGSEPVLLKHHYHEGMDVGHHTAYDFCMALASGCISLDEAFERLNRERDDLEYSIMAYGTQAYLKHLNSGDERADALMDKLLMRDGFWISYAYLAAWNEKYRM